MRTLNGARRAIGLSGQGIGCSPVVITNTLKQLDRENCSAALPLTVAALKSVLEKKMPVSEKVAVGSLSEINQLRSQVKQRMTMEQGETDAQEEDDSSEMAPGRPS